MKPICDACSRGHHAHDRHTGLIAAFPAGTDGGCPNATQADRCYCPVVLPPTLGPARHCPSCTCPPFGRAS